MKKIKVLFILLSVIYLASCGSDKNNINQTSAGTRILAFKAFNDLYWDNPLGTGPIRYGMGGTGKQDYKLRSFLKDRSSQMHVGYLSLFYMY